ncbi:MAG: 4-alpha-glucanotransferase [Candidatus Gastranaerophilales bacterium]|nr:4-alpha-glucanotransferase [Candidatus Gastranaerophilales bacterium]
MRLEKVVRITSGNMGRNVAFTRAPKKGNEEKQYTQAIEKGLDYLGIQNRALILHGPSFPANPEGNDTQIGSPFEADRVVEFAKIHGFNQIQLGPNGKLNKGDTSPYTSSVFEKNPLFINEQMLTTDDFAGILSQEDIEKASKKTKTNGQNYARIDFKKANENKSELISVAYSNFKEKLAQRDQKALRLNDEFEAFKTRSADWIEYYSVLNVISKKHNTDFYPYWPQEDQNLIQDVKRGDRFAISRFEGIKKDNADFIEQYKFAQFLVGKQAKIDANKRGDFTYIGDIEVGTSSLDEVVFKDVFLDGWKIGCPDGGPMNSPQLWGMAVLDPNKLFNDDGTLGPAGKFLKAKLVNGMTGAQGVRIDHAIGLVNPYIYRESTVHKIRQNGVEIPDKNRLHAGRMCNIGLDRNHNYEKILTRIVLPTMREMGVNPQDVIWEDLGWDESGAFQKIFRGQLHLPGISGMKWTKSSDVNRAGTAYIGCHDDKPGKQIIESGEYKNWEYCWNPQYLAQSLHPVEGNKRADIEQKVATNPKDFWKAKVADLLKSGAKNEQFTFMDVLGIDRLFNTPGTSGGDNWTLRMNPNFEAAYYRDLENDGWALNMPEVLAMAVEARMEQDIVDRTKTEFQARREAQPIIRDLNKWAQILKEKEN